MENIIDDVEGKGNYDLSDLPELLKQYYKRLFPCKLYYKWLNYGGGMLACFYCICKYHFLLIIFIKD